MIQMKNSARRTAAVAVLMAVLLVPMLGMVAFAVDMGWIVVAQADLQSAADAAALAGAQMLIGQQQYNQSTHKYSLMNGFAQYYAPGQTQKSAIVAAATTAAITAAKNNASSNTAGSARSLILNSSDIEFGTTTADGTYTKINGPGYERFPNTIKVTLYLQGDTNGSLPLFFGPVLGKKTVDLQATATATIYAGTLDSLTTAQSYKSGILPVAYDVNHWNNFVLTGQGPDGTTNLDSGGTPQLQVYPSIKFTGNFGLLSLDQDSDGASTIRDWINNGVPGSDLQQEINAGLLPLSAHSPLLPPDWKGDSGLRTDDIEAMNGHHGDTYLLPLFKPVNPGTALLNYADYIPGVGNGTHYYFDIVQFVSVTITSNPGDHFLTVDVGPYMDPNIVFQSGSVKPAVAPAAGNTNLPLIYSTPKLTR